MTLAWNLNFWNTGEWDVCREKADDLRKQGVRLNPDRKDWFASLARTPLEKTKAVLLGQDPYPNSAFATGFAYSVPASIPYDQLPPTLRNIFNEYQTDLKLPKPASGDLLHWADSGVLLWNSIPICINGRSLSCDWDEWSFLTEEIIKKTVERGAVIVLMGSRAQKFAHLVPDDRLITTSHPSPLAYKGGRTPKNSFLGSRLFSRINERLAEPINWRLPDEQSRKDTELEDF